MGRSALDSGWGGKANIKRRCLHGLRRHNPNAGGIRARAKDSVRSDTAGKDGAARGRNRDLMCPMFCAIG
jgi:hypothetical protein